MDLTGKLNAQLTRVTFLADNDSLALPRYRFIENMCDEVGSQQHKDISVLDFVQQI
jgi:hypothetical protein